MPAAAPLLRSESLRAHVTRSEEAGPMRSNLIAQLRMRREQRQRIFRYIHLSIAA